MASLPLATYVCVVLCLFVLMACLPDVAWAVRPASRSFEACPRCHDAEQGSDSTPKLEGLSRSYLIRQIESINRGERVASVDGATCSLAALSALTPADYVAVIDLNAAFVPGPQPLGEAPPEALALGEELYREGRLDSGTQACAACHGWDATGGVQRGLEAAVVAPRLAGQRQAYLRAQLLSFRKGVRANDFSGIMRSMVKDLSDADVDAVAWYLSTLDPAAVPPRPSDAAAADVPEKVALCQTCHGLGGESMMDTFPKIGGLSRGHITKQLLDIRAGRRDVEVMAPIALSLSDDEIDAVATYFSGLEMRRGPYDPLKAARGEALFYNGNLVTGYPACMYCHSADGRGISDVPWAPGDVPRLAGQHPGYLRKALGDFRSGARANDHGALMRLVAVRMTDQEIDDVSHFLYSLGEGPR